MELTEEEEELIVERLVLVSRWGFPLSKQELRKIIQEYLNLAGRSSRFIDNLPGPDFARGFMRRHKKLTIRMANPIKRSRAELSPEIVQEFFGRLSKVAEGVPPQNILNYDETNLQNNPGAKAAIYRKGVKYAEQVRDHSKECITVMMCGSASGEMLPPYVIYKAKYVRDTWTEGGPEDALYHATPSGWIDSFLFTDWFKKIALPYLKQLEGKKILIGDNLQSHFSDEVLRLCAANNVEFICLPVNSTHKLQPLDVGFFAPMKREWRKQLNELKDTNPDVKALAKPNFPGMLKRLLDQVDHKRLLPAAFKACGLYPLDVDRALRDIPNKEDSQQIARHLDSSLLKKLETQRYGDQQKKPPRGKALPAGQSYSAKYMARDEEEEDEDESEDEEEDEEEDGDLESGPDELPELNRPVVSAAAGKTTLLVAIYEGEWFVAERLADQSGVPAGSVKLTYMAPRGINVFVWPERPDIMETLKEDILVENIAIEPSNSRGHFRVKDNDYKRVKCLMVVVYFKSEFFFGGGC